MHYDRIGFRAFHALPVDSEIGEVLIGVRNAVEIANALALNSQRHDDIGVA